MLGGKVQHKVHGKKSCSHAAILWENEEIISSGLLAGCRGISMIKKKKKKRRAAPAAELLGPVGVVPAGFVLLAGWEHLKRAQSLHKNVQFSEGRRQARPASIASKEAVVTEGG